MINQTPPSLKPYIFHGLNGLKDIGRPQAISDCPLCKKESKFFINTKTGLWDCKGCRAMGNPASYLQQLWAISDEVTKDYSELTKDRRLLFDDTLMHWRAARSVASGDWVIPGYNAVGTLTQLYRYRADAKTKKRRLLATSETQHGLHGVPLYRQDCDTVYLLEGYWDGSAFWEIMRMTKDTGHGYAQTGSESSSLLANACVLATPGCNVFQEAWAPLFSGKRVILIYDNDHEKPHPTTGKMIQGAAYLGMKRVSEILSRADTPPSEIHYVQWGSKTYFNPDLPSGFDVRDFLTKDAPDVKSRIGLLEKLLAKIRPIPDEWVSQRTNSAKKHGGLEVDMLPCEKWSDLINAWRKALLWTDGLDRALACMLACVTSTRYAGDQLWMKIIGPAACGKSTLCEALSVNKGHIVAKSTIRGFHSGFRSDGGETDNSLLSQLADKTLVTKDGDTLLQSPNLPQILSEARDVYDRTSRTHYRHGMQRDYEGLSMTWILCGTSSLRSLDTSELGERFLDCVIMDGVDLELEDQILLRVAHRAAEIVTSESEKEIGGYEEMSKVMRLTGGYINYLKDSATEKFKTITVNESALRKCIDLGKFTAYMRARPSLRQDENAEREFGTRLVSQLVRLAKCLCVVLNKSVVDEEVLQRVCRVAFDTSRGKSIDIVKRLYQTPTGMPLMTLAVIIGMTEERMTTYLNFLRKIGIVQIIREKKQSLAIKPKWKLTDFITNLYQKVLECHSSTNKPQ